MDNPYRHILFTREGKIGFVTMNRPEKRNALSVEHMDELIACFKAIGEDKTLSVVILRGNGPVFSAGHDLGEMLGRDADFYAHEFEVCTVLMQTIQGIPQPVIAQVQGIATAAGCQLVATCDLAIASESATFCTPGVSIGLFCSTPMVALSRNVPRKQALEMLLLGETMAADEAVRYGLVNRAVFSDLVMPEALEMARRIAAKSKATVAIGKEAFYRQIELPLTEAYAYAAEVMVKNMMSADATEGICAFVEKRPPVWKDQ